MEKNLHNQFYDLREKTWKELEKIVREGGCKIIGEFPIIVGHLTLPPNGLRKYSVYTSDKTEITINGIQGDEDYTIFPDKENENDINVYTNKITVFIENWHNNIQLEIEVEPDLLNLQALCTYLSGGYDAYDNEDNDTEDSI